jgi:hypothetical protein
MQSSNESNRQRTIPKRTSCSTKSLLWGEPRTVGVRTCCIREAVVDIRTSIFLMTELTGVAMVVGGMWLIYKQKVYIDKESNQPVEVKLPGNFSFKSNYPALALFVLGFFPLIYPFHRHPGRRLLQCACAVYRKRRSRVQGIAESERARFGLPDRQEDRGRRHRDQVPADDFGTLRISDHQYTTICGLQPS